MASAYDVRNPRTGQIDYWITPPTIERLTAICTDLRTAQVQWQKIGVQHRIESLQQWKRIIQEQRDNLIHALVLDTGRLAVSQLEVDSLLSSLDRWCRLAPDLLREERRETSIPFIQVQSGAVPYSLVGVISPWNFPLLLSLIDAVPALLAGCAVIIKPSEITPRFIQPLLKTIAAVPRLHDVLTYVEGAGDTGSALIDQVDLVCFTGSVATGRKVAEMAAKRFIPAFLELGGKDPAIVLETADLGLATSAILWGAVVNTGQSCLSIERIYVAESIIEPFVTQLVAKAKQLQLAFPAADSGPIGPIIAERQAAIIEAHLRDAVAKGAVIHCGGAIEQHGGGLWCRPTVLSQVDHTMKVMSEETFGPIMPIMPFAAVEDAISLANDTLYGLSAAVFAGSEAEALAVAQHIQAGAISINDAALTGILQEAEKHSFKFSGLGGSRMGSAAFMRFLRKKAYLLKTQPVVDPWWFDTKVD